MGAPTALQWLRGEARFVVARTVYGTLTRLLKVSCRAPPLRVARPEICGGGTAKVVKVRSPPRAMPALFVPTRWK